MNFLLRKDLHSRGIRFSNKHLLTLESKGKFPKRVYLGEKTPGWPESEVDAYQQRIMDDRSADKAA